MERIFKLPPFTVHHTGDIQTLSQIYPQAVRDFDIPKVWKKTKGKGIVVMIIDTGCPLNHKDLTGNINYALCRSFVDGEDIYDRVGHSSHVAGSVGAIDNSTGVVGIAPEVQLITVKALDNNGQCTSINLINSLNYAIKVKPDIINMSLGSEFPMSGVHELIKKLVANNTIVVCSSGNNGENKVLYPAQYDEVIAVGSYSDSVLRNRSEFSSWGETLDIMAPGDKILSTYLNNGYSILSGTSMASPSISGIVALLLSYHKSLGKTLTVDQVKDLLYANCVDLGDKGKDLQHGWGIIDPEKLFSASIQSLPKAVKKESGWDKFKNFFGKLFKR
jgi:subtilisin family serine protease